MTYRDEDKDILNEAQHKLFPVICLSIKKGKINWPSVAFASNTMDHV